MIYTQSGAATPITTLNLKEGGGLVETMCVCIYSLEIHSVQPGQVLTLLQSLEGKNPKQTFLFSGGGG